MKKSLVLGLMAAFFLSAGPANGQGLSVGAKAGASFASVHGEGLEGFDGLDSVTGITIGGLARFGLAPMLAIQPEVLFSQRGFSMSLSNELIGDISSDVSLSYVDIPVLARLSVPVPAGVSPYVVVGPTASLNLGCSATATVGGQTETLDCDEGDTTFPISGTGFSFTAGGGLDFGVPMGQATLDVRYDIGMSSLADSVEGQDPVDVKSRAFAITLGVAMGL